MSSHHNDEDLSHLELNQLKRQYKDLINKRKQLEVKENSTSSYYSKIVFQLKEEKQNTLKEFRLATSSSCNARDGQNCKKIQDLLIEKNTILRRIDSLKKENEKLDSLIKSTEAKVHQQRIKSSKLKFEQTKATSSAQHHLKMLCVLEGRLNREESKCNAILAQNASIRDLIDTLVNEKHKFQRRFNKLDSRLQNLTLQVSSILDMSLTTHDQIGEITTRNFSLRDRLVSEHNQFSSDKMELEVDMNSKIKWRSFMNTMQNSRSEHFEARHVREIQKRVQQDIERENKLAKLERAWSRIIDSVDKNNEDGRASLRKSSANSGSPSEGCTGTGAVTNTTSYPIDLQNPEAGCLTVEKIMEKSKKLEEENFAAFIENNYQFAKNDRLREELEDVKKQIEFYYLQTARQEKSSGCDLNLKKLEIIKLKELDEKASKEYYVSASYLLQLEKGLKQLRTSLKLDQKEASIMGSFGECHSENDLLTSDQIRTYLANIEEHICSLISCHYYKIDNGIEMWSYFADPSKVHRVSRKSKPDNSAWNAVRKSVGYCHTVVQTPESKAIILQPISQIDIAKKLMLPMSRSSKRRLSANMRRLSHFMSADTPENESDNDGELTADNLENYIVDDEVMSIENLIKMANDHYEARYNLMIINKNRRRSTISRRFSYRQ